MLNHITIMGRLVRPPEPRRTSSGVAVCTITLAVDRDFKGPNGEKEADFIDVVTWKGTTEFTAKYFAKGREVIQDAMVQGRFLRNDGWQNILRFSDDFSVDKKRPRVEIIVEEGKEWNE